MNLKIVLFINIFLIVVSCSSMSSKVVEVGPDAVNGACGENFCLKIHQHGEVTHLDIFNKSGIPVYLKEIKVDAYCSYPKHAKRSSHLGRLSQLKRPVRLIERDQSLEIDQNDIGHGCHFNLIVDQMKYKREKFIFNFFKGVSE